MPQWKFQCPVPEQGSGGRGNVWGDWEGKGRRKDSLAAAENHHADASPQHRTLAKEKQGSWTVSRGALEMLSLELNVKLWPPRAVHTPWGDGSPLSD